MNTVATQIQTDEDRGLAHERERSMQESQSDFMESIGDVPVHVADLDMDGVYVSWDAVALRILGYTSHEVVGNMHFCCMCADAYDFECAWHAVQERDWFSGRVLLRRNGGETFYAWLTLAKTFDAAGAHIGYRITAIDANDQRRMLRAYARHVKEMYRLQKLAEEEPRIKLHEDVSEDIPAR